MKVGIWAAMSTPLLVALSSLSAAAGAAPPRPLAVACKAIATAAQLQAMQNNLAGSYCLTADIDAGSIANFVPVGPVGTPFTGKLFGNNHVIKNLKINTSTAKFAGLFGVLFNTAVVQDLGLVNPTVATSVANGAAGGLAGGSGAGKAIKGVFVLGGQVKCTGSGCYAGGILGTLETTGNSVSQSWSSAAVTGVAGAGGAFGFATDATVAQVYATGSVRCTDSTLCYAGGLIGSSKAVVSSSFAAGPVVGAATSYAGGLIGYMFGSGTLQQAFATGPVSGGTSAEIGGLIGRQSDASISETYAVGPVTGGMMAGGLVGNAIGTPAVTSSYWDTDTTGQMTSAGGYGTGMTTAQLRGALPAGFGTAWDISKNLSFPFINDADLELTSQLVASEYIGTVNHSDAASLATVYTMIARAIGITKNVATLKNIKINKSYWIDSSQKTRWIGAVTNYATLGTLTDIGANVRLANSNVLGQLGLQKLVILRGTYTKNGGGTATHWMLATLYVRDADNKISAVVAHDPWTGMQIEIDPATKKVIMPSNFPLTGFKVNGYQTVTLK